MGAERRPFPLPGTVEGGVAEVKCYNTTGSDTQVPPVSDFLPFF